MSSPNPVPLLPNPQYVTDPDAKLHRAEDEILALRCRVESLQERNGKLLREVHDQHDLLAAIGRENGEHCDACAGSGRDLLGQRNRLSELEWQMAWQNEWDELDAEYPDDCDAKGCFDGWRVVDPR